MTIEELVKLSKVLVLSKHNTNILFIDKHAMTQADAHDLGVLISEKNPYYGCIVMTEKNPNESIKLISEDKETLEEFVKNIEVIDESTE